MPPKNRTMQFLVYGPYALFTDPVTKIGGERHTYPIPTFEALRGIMDSIYWKPTIRWFIDRVRIMTPIQKESIAIRSPRYYEYSSDRSYNTYLRDVAYQVEAHFEWAKPGPGFEKDRIAQKHLEIAKRSIQSGGRYDVFLGSRECQAYVEPCVFGEGEGAYDDQPKMTFGLMFHGYNYPELTGRNTLEARLWHASMEYGVITFPRPEDCPIVRHIRDMRPKKFTSKSEVTEPLPPKIPAHDLGQPDILKKGMDHSPCEDFTPWEKKLCETYDNLVAADLLQEEKSGILPIGHISKPSQIQIDLDEDGSYIYGSAKVLPKEDAATVIPCSPSSQFRTRGMIPHLLFDSMQYMAGDCAKYSAEPIETAFSAYIDQLKACNNSLVSTPTIHAVYEYLKEGTLVEDLITDGILPVEVDSDGIRKVPSRWNRDGPEPEIYGVCDVRKGPLSSQVRIRVVQNGELNEIWNDPNVQQSAVDFNNLVMSRQGIEDICYVTGKKAPVSTLHPYVHGNTKLISSNDDLGFTYRFGQLDLPEHRVRISYEASQKMHLALRWLLGHQSFTVGSQTYLLWSTHNHEIPKILSTQNLSEPLPSDGSVNLDVTMQSYFRQVRDYIQGYENKLTPDDESILMSLATPSTGRTSITNYQPMVTSDLLHHILNWHETCYAQLPVKDKGIAIRSPSVFEITSVALGPDNGKEAQERIEQAILISILLGQPLPRNIVNGIFHNIVRSMCHPAKSQNPFYDKDLQIAAAVIRKYLTDKGEDFQMEDRGTLFGRILAYYYRVESYSQHLAGNGFRTTNAEKLISQYCQLPARTLGILEQRIIPYRNRVQRTVLGRQLLGELDTLLAHIPPGDLTNTPLDEKFILGYHAQLSDFRAQTYQRKDAEHV